MKKAIFAFVVVVVITIGILGFSGKPNGNLVSAQTVDLYKSPTCGCCIGHSKFLGRDGFDVNLISTPQYEAEKVKNNIPREMWSCHTSIIGDYFVEGHMPMEAIQKLLEEQPDIDGIALPNMPAGSPGMPGVKSYPWTIYSIKDGEISEFMTI
jgi:hypothetical protein